MTLDAAFVEQLRDLFAGLPGLRFNRMFGAMGVYAEGVFFAIADDGVVYLKADEQTSHRFVDAGSRPFVFEMKDRTIESASYWSLPETAFDDPEEAMAWARLAIAAARRKKAR